MRERLVASLSFDMAARTVEDEEAVPLNSGHDEAILYEWEALDFEELYYKVHNSRFIDFCGKGVWRNY